VSGGTRTRRRPAVSDGAKLQRRDEIMDAAKKVFARNGFHATTIADIAKEANLAYGSVYQYFDSKDDLFHALMSAEGYALRTRVAAALAAASKRSDRTWEPLRATVQATFALGDRFEKHLSSIYERFTDDLADFMVAAQRRGKVISALPRMVAYSLAALIGQLAHRRLTTDDGVTAAEGADFVVSLILNGLRPRESSTD
jgi:AcrR family transcriptional regulator